MSDITFRTKTEAPTETTNKESANYSNEGKKETVASVKEEKLSPLLWSQTNEKPYLVKLLGLENVYEDLDADISEGIDVIEEYFKSLIKKGKRTNDESSYKEMFSYLEKITGTKNAPLRNKLKQIADFIKTIQRAKELWSTKG